MNRKKEATNLLKQYINIQKCNMSIRKNNCTHVYHRCMKLSVNLLPITSDNLGCLTCLKVELWAPYTYKVQGVRLPAKSKPFSPINIWLFADFPRSSMNIIYDKLQYPVSNCFIKDKSLFFFSEQSKTRKIVGAIICSYYVYLSITIRPC